MSVSPQALALLREFEGLRLEAYPDPASGGAPWTIGYGHTRGVQPGDKITRDQAEAYLEQDAAEAEAAVRSLIAVPLTQNQCDALVSFVFNVGAGALQRSTLLRKLNAGDFSGAADEFLRWNNAAGQRMPGLTRRRQAERALFLQTGGAASPLPGPQPQSTPAPQATAHPTRAPEKPMLPLLPFIAAALPALIEAAPGLIRIFGDSPQAEKNAKAAEAVAEIAKQATGQTTIEGAVQVIQADPAAAAAFRERCHQSMGELLGLIERVNELEQRNIAAARQYNTDEPLFIDTPWLKLKFIHLLSLVFVSFSGYFVQRYWGDLTPELRGAVITLMIIAGWNGVRDYWMGSSSGSDRKTSEILRQQRE